MGLLIPIESEFGTTMNYWKLIGLSINFETKTAWANIAGYANKEAKDSNKNFLGTRQIDLTVDIKLNDEVSVKSIPLDLEKKIYEIIKEAKEFKFALDVFEEGQN